jgi:hypothetical protein
MGTGQSEDTHTEFNQGQMSVSHRVFGAGCFGVEREGEQLLTQDL